MSDGPTAPESHRTTLPPEWTGPLAETPGTLLHEAFERRAEAAPDATALVLDDRTLTYAELNRRANRLAHELIARGVGPESVVAVAIRRSPELVVALYGIVKAGAAYLPIDPDQPAGRSALILHDARPRVVVTHGEPDALDHPVLDLADGAALDGAPAHDPTDDDRVGSLLPSHPAYVIYTSGSTGVPKGVLVPHEAIVNRVAWAQEYFGLGPDDRYLQKTPAGFDVSVPEFFWPLAVGATLVLARPAGHRDPWYLAEVIERERITTVHFVPSMLRIFLDEADVARCTSLRRVFSSGEALTAALLADFRRVLDVPLHNLYGPTEAAVDVTWWSSENGTDGDSVPIGRPVRNTGLRILDGDLHPVGPGVTGELHLTGVQLARGYLGRPALTARTFLPDPFGPPGTRMYRTGDLARTAGNGDVEYLGRADHQVKIRGVRVEPGEVAAVLAANEMVANCAVLAQTHGDETRLIAHVVPASRPGADLAAEHTDGWRSIYETLYAAGAETGLGEDFAGWNSAVDNSPIPAAQMDEWRADTVARIRALAPRRVLEIGVGTGLLLAAIAPDVEEYWGTDISASVLDRLRTALGSRPDLGDRVRLLERAADDLAGVPVGRFDTVVINSVVQYLPSADHLRAVLRGCARVLAPGGTVFVGDVRNLRLLRAFHADVLHERLPEDVPPTARELLLDRAVLLDGELNLDPGFFRNLPHELPAVTGVEVDLRRGSHHNEMNRFRYDVVLRTDARPAAEPETVRWEPGCDLEELLGRAARSSTGLAVFGVPNSRVVDAVGRAGAVPGPEAGPPLDPHRIYRAGERLGLRVVVMWSEDHDDRVDVLAGPAGSVRALPPATGPGRPHANDPTAATRARVLAPAVTAYLRERLPEVMVPSTIRVQARIPHTTNGKADHATLSAAEPRETRDRTAPRTRDETLLCQAFRDVLGVESVGVHDSFFDLGGHSLSATKLIGRIVAALGCEITLTDVFEAPEVAALARRIRHDDTSPRTALTPRERPDPLPLSAGQYGLWFLDQLSGPSGAYNVPIALRLRGTPDRAALAAAIDDLVDRHEALRTTFPTRDGHPHQRIRPDTGGPVLVEHRCAADELSDLLAASAERPFALDRELPVRAWLYSTGPEPTDSSDTTGDGEQHVLLLVVHHIVCDGWSIAPLLQDIATAYTARTEGRAPAFTPLPVQYADYTTWQRERLGPDSDPDSPARRQAEHWRHALRDLPAVVSVPTDRPRPSVAGPHRAGSCEAVVGPDLHRGLGVVAARHRATLFMVVQAAIVTLLRRHGAGDDIPIGTPAAGRTDAALDDLVGYFVTTLVLRTDASGDPTFGELLDRVRAADLAAYAHQELPFDRVVDAVGPPRSPAFHPLFQVMLAFENPDPVVVLPGLEVEHATPPPGTAKFDLTFTVTERYRYDGSRTGLHIRLDHDAELFDAPTGPALLDDLLRILSAAAGDPTLRPAETAGSGEARSRATPDIPPSRPTAPGPDPGPVDGGPTGPTETALLAAFGDVLGADAVDRHTGFFALGGDSIKAITMVSRARSRGVRLTVSEVLELQSVAALAAHVDAAGAPGTSDDPEDGAGNAGGDLARTPIACWWRERGGPARGYTQYVVVRTPPGLTEEQLRSVARALLDRHEMLRLDAASPPGRTEPVGRVSAADHVVTDPSVDPGDADALRRAAEHLARSLDPGDGRPVGFLHCRPRHAGAGALVLAVHHLAVDGVSWRVLLEDLATAGAAVLAGEPVSLPEPGTSFRRWTHRIAELGDRGRLRDRLGHWGRAGAGSDARMTTGALDGGRDRVGTARHDRSHLAPQVTAALTAACRSRDLGLHELLAGVTALAVAGTAGASGAPEVVLALEGHGREEGVVPADLSRTVGWFTTLFPLRFAVPAGGADGDGPDGDGERAVTAARAAATALARTPDRGLSYGVLRYLDDAGRAALAGQCTPEVLLNYLGRLTVDDGADWGPWDGGELVRSTTHPDTALSHPVELNVVVHDHDDGPHLTASWSWAPSVVGEASARELVRRWTALLEAVAGLPAGPRRGPVPGFMVALDPGELSELTAGRPGGGA